MGGSCARFAAGSIFFDAHAHLSTSAAERRRRRRKKTNNANTSVVFFPNAERQPGDKEKKTLEIASASQMRPISAHCDFKKKKKKSGRASGDVKAHNLPSAV